MTTRWLCFQEEQGIGLDGNGCLGPTVAWVEGQSGVATIVNVVVVS